MLFDVRHSISGPFDHKPETINQSLPDSGKPLGLLINFNESLLKNGITRVINEPAGFPDPSVSKDQEKKL